MKHSTFEATWRGSGPWVRPLLLATIISLGQTACGGGGGGGTPTPPPNTPSVTLSLSATDVTSGNAISVPAGTPVTLTWTSTDVTACTGGGSLTGNFASSGSQLVTQTTADPYTFTLNCTGNDGTATGSATLTVTPPPLTVWVPDYGDRKVRVYIGGPSPAPMPVTVDLTDSCYPNSVVVSNTPTSDLLYVACSGGAPPAPPAPNPFPNAEDQILVYDAGAIRTTAPGTEFAPTPTLTIDDANIMDQPAANFYSGLVGMALDASGNLYVAAYNIGMVYEYAAGTQAGGLGTATPVSTLVLQDSPSAPAGLTFDSNGILWVTGTAGGPLVLGFDPSQFLPNGQNVPSYCLGVGQAECSVAQGEPGTPNDWEGVAAFNGEIWVSNNNAPSQNADNPGYYVYGFTVTVPGTPANPGTMVYSNSIGTGSTTGLQCPGGLFAGTHLWINDEGFGDTNPTPTFACGDPGDEITNGSGGGGVFALSATDLTAGPLAGYVTGRPGFGGIYVENDN